MIKNYSKHIFLCLLTLFGTCNNAFGMSYVARMVASRMSRFAQFQTPRLQSPALTRQVTTAPLSRTFRAPALTGTPITTGRTFFLPRLSSTISTPLAAATSRPTALASHFSTDQNDYKSNTDQTFKQSPQQMNRNEQPSLVARILKALGIGGAVYAASTANDNRDKYDQYCRPNTVETLGDPEDLYSEYNRYHEYKMSRLEHDFQMAFEQSDYKTIGQLIDIGVNPNESLIEAVKASDTKMVEFLIAKGADPNKYSATDRLLLGMVNQENQTRANNNQKMVKILLKGGLVYNKDHWYSGCDHPMLKAMADGYLLKLWLWIFAPNLILDFELATALKKANFPVIKNAIPNIISDISDNKKRKTFEDNFLWFLIRAVETDAVDAVSILLEMGVSPTAKRTELMYDGDISALELATKIGNPEIITMLQKTDI